MNAKWICPTVTPFNEDGTVDFESAAKHYDFLIENGIDGDAINERLKQPFELCSHCNPEKCFFD